MDTPSLEVMVRRRELQGAAVVVLELADPAGAPLPAFKAGAHVDVHLAEGLIRQYSLCGDPAHSEVYRLGVLRDPGSRGGSIRVHEELVEGRRLTISAPRNHFPLSPEAPYSLLVGGGIGITPMLAMAAELHARGAAFEMHYCSRTRAGSAFLDELAAAPWADRVRLHFDDEGAEQIFDPAKAAATLPGGTHLYVCGPAGFMDWVMGSMRSAGLPEARIHREYFNAPVAAPTTPAEAFEVVAQRSGKTVTVRADQSIVDALKTVGVRIQVSCEEGVCGTCLCEVLEGVPEHRDVYLTEEERADNDQILPCCSRAKSPRLVLDV